MNILVVSFIASHNISDNAGNTNYIYSITSYLQSLGHKIHFLYINTNVQNYDLKAMQDKWDYVQVLDAFDLDIWNSAKFKNLDFAYKSYIGETANNICKKFNIDMCICHYFPFSKLLESLPKNIVKVIDTHDLFTNRFAYFHKYLLNKEFFNLTKKHEAIYLNRADIILARTNQEKEFFNKITNSNKSITITYFNKDSKFLNKNYTNLKTIGFVGSYNKANALCILKFLNEFEKEYKQGNLKDIKIEVVGNTLQDYNQIYKLFSFPSRLKLFINYISFRTFFNIFRPNLAKPFIKVISKRDYFINNGFIENLDDFYNRVDLIVLPMLLGTGVNIKTAEALSKGIPVISTVNGFKGFDSNKIEHNATNIKQLIKFIKNIQNYPIKLQSLANVSKKVYLDYKNTLNNNLNNFFARVKKIILLKENKINIINLTFPKVLKPKVSIIVPVYRNLQLTLNCLSAVLQNTQEISYEVIVIDDASDDEVINLKSYVKNVKIIRNPTNLGYLKNCNLGSEIAQGEYLLFLNSDTLVHKDWLKYILETFEFKNDAGIVGGMLLNPDGSIQEAGGFLANTELPDLINSINTPLYGCNYLKTVDYISGACLCITKKLFFEVGKLDEIYGHGYAEDPDLCMKVRELGYEVYYQPKAKITHLGSQTFTKTEKKHLIEKNNKIFFSKWKKQLHKDNIFLKGYDYHISELFLLRNRSKNKKTILCFDDNVPSNFHGGGRSSLGFLELFVELGFNVKFFPEHLNISYEKNNLEYLQQKGIEVIYPNSELIPFLEINGKFIDYVFLQRPYTIKYINDLKKFTRAKIIYYGHDLHYLRLQRSLNFNKNKDTEIQSNQLKEIEFKLIKISDVVYYPSILEVKLLQKEIPSANINLLTPYYYNTNNKLNILPNKPINKRNNILFVGSTHQPNIDGLLWFLQEVWGKLLEKTNNSIYLNIVGDIIEKIENINLSSLNLNNINFLGKIKEEELIKVYYNTRVAICPILYGMGVMSKVVEAIYYKVPIVSTNIGTEGLVGDYSNLVYTANSSSNFIKQIIHIFDEKYVYNEAKAKKYIDDYFSRKCILKQLKDNYIINC